MLTSVTYRVNDIALPFETPTDRLRGEAATRFGLPQEAVCELRVVRKVLDARNKGRPRYVYSVEVELDGATTPKRLPAGVVQVPPPEPAPCPVRPPDRPPLIVGTGPAGLFCALGLLERGVPSVLIERGREVGARRKDVARLMRDGSLDPESNMNFGEGGAGAYTDGKLTTRVNHPHVRKVLEAFVRFGANERILVDGKPHVGSEVLPEAVARLREHLKAGGCQVLFERRMEDILREGGRVLGIRCADGSRLESDRVVLAPGNSARELYERFAADGSIHLEAMPFAVGFRVEHPQELINEIQYGGAAQDERLPPADYRLAQNLPSPGGTRGVFSFCMCPGGLLVPTPTEAGHQCTNGMSNSRRNSRFANAGIVTQVAPADFAREGFVGPLAGLRFQKYWEQQAFELGGGRFFAPVQSVPGFLAGERDQGPRNTSYRPGVSPADLNVLFPESIRLALKEGLVRFGRTMKGFVTAEAFLFGIESRTSSPVRITRGKDLQSVSLRGLYPAGEGCGYAGGIVSSAIDGLRVAEQIARELA